MVFNRSVWWTFGHVAGGVVLYRVRGGPWRLGPDGRRVHFGQTGVAMKAHVGDWLVIKAPTVERPDQRGLILEVRSADGSPPYVVRWLATGHVATVFPSADAVVVTPEEQAAADERERARFASVQTAIAHRTKAE